MKIVVLLSFFGLCGGSYNTADLEELSDYSSHPCARQCEDGGQPRVCVYDFTLELYYTLSRACLDCPYNLTDCYRPYCVPADGVARGLLTANRVLPGPAIQVCENDEIVVNVLNRMESTGGTTIHWHGFLQRGTPYMDGVSMVTQCPIPHMSNFQYRVKAVDPGTYWWHAHAGLQRSNGLFGHLVVRQTPSRDPHRLLYDYDLPEHVISVTDWLNEMTDNRFAAHHHDGGDNKPDSMLINGKGAFREFLNTTSGGKWNTPYAEFKVSPGKKYRFRVISAVILNCPIQFSIDDHNLMVIASDGGNFDPVVVDSFNVFTGERFDFVLTTRNSSSAESFWIRARGVADCSVKKAHQVAVLRYEGAPQTLPGQNSSWEASNRLGITLNAFNTRGNDTVLSLDRLNATKDIADDDSLKPVPDKKFYLAMDFNKIDNFHFHTPGLYPLNSFPKAKQLYSPQMNHISFVLPSVPLLTQFAEINEKTQFCNADEVQVDCKAKYCECTHRLKVALGDVVELILIDEGVIFNANHPMHLHGYKFRVIGMDRLNESTSLEEVKALDKAGQLRRKLTRAPLKDTVTVPDGGYTIVRFKADNPGMWLLHCHVEFHLSIGMGLVLQVGEPAQFPARPKNFPECRAWTFTGLEEPSLRSNSTTTLGTKASQAPDQQSMFAGVLAVLCLSLVCSLLY